jgi:hypothetical protein
MEELPPVLEPQPDQPKPPATSLAARLLNVFAVPGDVFEEVKAGASSVGNWLAPALLLIPVSWVGAWLMFAQPSIQQQLRDMTDRTIEKQVEKMGLSPEKAEQARQTMQKYGAISQKFSAYAAPVFLAFASPFLWGLILWVAGTKGLKGRFSYMKAVEVAGLANAIAVLDVVVRMLLAIGLGNLFASPSPALLLKDFDPQKPSHSLLAAASIMTFWLLAVRALGLARLSGVPFARAAIWVLGVWAAYNSLFLGLGFALQSAFR